MPMQMNQGKRRGILLGLILPSGGLLVFLLLAWAVSVGEAVPAWDRRWAEMFRDHGQDFPLLRSLLIGCTRLGDITPMTTLAVVGTLWQLVRRRWSLAAFWAVTALGGALLNVGVKEVIARERPPVEWRDPIVHETNESFPSGHAMGAIIGFGIVGYVLTRTRPSKWPITICTILAILIVMICFSRIFLRAHWASDVLGGFALGLAWLTLCLLVLHRLDRKPRPEFG